MRVGNDAKYLDDLEVVHAAGSGLRIQRPGPKSHYCHYSNPSSQNTLICETKGFPDYLEHGEQVQAAYSDRILQWSSDRFNRACKLAGRGDDSQWAWTLPLLSDEKLKEFAAVALDLEQFEVLHARAVYHFNHATGFSCPEIQAIFKKK